MLIHYLLAFIVFDNGIKTLYLKLNLRNVNIPNVLVPLSMNCVISQILDKHCMKIKSIFGYQYLFSNN